MSKDAGCLSNGEVAYDSTSRLEPKRLHQWFMDGGETELFPNKKQAVEVPSSNAFSGIPPSTLSPWGNVSGFPSVPSQLNERFFDPDATRTINFDDRNIASVNAGNLNMGRKVMDDPFGDNSSFGLSMSQSVEDPKSNVNYGGIRRVKVSEVTDSENAVPMSVGSSYSREDNSVVSTAHVYGGVDDSSISMGLAYGQEEDNVGNMGDSYVRGADNFMSMGSFNKLDGNMMGMGHNYKYDSNVIPTVNSLGKGDGDIMSMAENYSKGDDNVISMGALSKGDDNIITMSQAYKAAGSFISMSNNYDKGGNCTMPIPQSNNKIEAHRFPMGHAFNKGRSNILSFGGFNDDDANASGRLMSSYDLLMSQPSVSQSDTQNQKDLDVSDANVLLNNPQILASAVESASRKKGDQKSAKKIPPNNFPSNVRSLLSTGILDEVPVKYIAWSREKELRGIIKGTGYLCGCQSCNFSKVINAYEFERHAGAKTKHPNNHIYFENGKTIYGIVQELRSTPQSMLFDAIQTITGSPVNQKSFRIWKESFLAATRELQRIYGTDDRNQPF